MKQYRISFEKLQEIYLFETEGIMPNTVTAEDFCSTCGMMSDVEIERGETFGEWFDRIKKTIDVYEEEA